MTAAAPATADGGAAGGSLLDEGPPAEKAKRKRAPKDPNALPTPARPTEVQVAKAEGAIDAAKLDADRQRAAKLIREAFDAEDRELEDAEQAAGEERDAVVQRVGQLAALEGDRDAALAQVLRPLVLGVTAMTDQVTPALLGACGRAVAAACGNALEEARAWDEQAEREARLYEARATRAKKRAARVRKLLESFVMEYCSVAPKDPGLKRWSFPTTTIVVGERVDAKGRLEVVDDDRAASALRKVCDPLEVSAAIKLTQKVYVDEARALLQAAVLAKKIPDLSRVDGFRWTPPGTVSRRVEDR